MKNKNRNKILFLTREILIEKSVKFSKRNFKDC